MPETPRFGRGAVPPPPDPRDFPFDAAHYGALAPAALPAVIDLRCGGLAPTPARPAGPVRNQGERPTCVGHAAALLRETLRVAAHAPFVRYSPSYVYKRANLLSGTLAADDGADPRAALQAMLTSGTCPEIAAPYDADDDVTPPTAAEDAAARPWRIGSYHACLDPQSAMQALAAGAPVIVTIRAGDAFDVTGADGIVSAAALGDTVTGWDHEVTLVGYTPDWWLLQNSWGGDWGNAGYFYVPKERFDFFNYGFTASLKAVGA